MEIFRTENSYVLLCGESTLWFDKTNGDISIKPAWEISNGHDPECMGIFFGYIGRVKCPTVIEDTILLVKESSLVGELPSGHAVHKIKSIAMLHPTNEVQDLGLKPCPKHHRTAYEQNEQNNSNSAISKTWSSLKTATTNIKTTAQHNAPLQFQNQTKREIKEREKFQRRIREEFMRIFTDTDSFYFCPAGGDITNTHARQRQYAEQGNHEWDDRFFWNKHMLQDVLQADTPLASAWIVPLIQGYVEIKQCKMCFGDIQKYEVFTVSLISRRSRHRVGTRYKRRGLDENGYCANYVETEQILQFKSHVVSFVQVRGSIPLYWSQQGYKYRPPPQLHKSYEENQQAMEKHLLEEIERYGPVVIINLVERDGKEAVVGDAYADHICTFNSDQITYVTFDFHRYCRGMKFENATLLIDEIQDEISRMNYSWIDNQGTIAEQHGVFRVNCIDCLDRTNVVQTNIAKEVLLSQLIKLGLMSPETPYDLVNVTQQMWANNGDVISKQYAGTNALKGDITRTGNRKISGLMKDGMNSANRYFRAYYADFYTQACLDLMHGCELESENMVVVLVDSVITPFVNQFQSPLISATQSGEQFAFTNELRLAEFLFLTTRYYLSRFKDTTRQATLDVMLGNKIEESIQQKDSSEDEEDSPVNEEEHQITIEHIKQVIDDVKQMLLEDSSQVIAAWALLNTDYQTVQDTPSSMEIDTILVLTRTSLFISDYDSELDKVVKFQEMPLNYIKLIEIVVWGASSPSSSGLKMPSPSRACHTQPMLTIHYSPNADKPNHLLQLNFKSTNLRFFNNIAVFIKNEEERVESLKAIAETIQVAYEIAGHGELEFNIRASQRKGSLLNTENFKADVQSSLKTVGSKALSNVSQQFSKFNKFGQNFKFTKNKTKDPEDVPASREVFLPTAGIVRSQTDIVTTLNEHEAPAIVIESEGSHGGHGLEKSRSTEHVDARVGDLRLNLAPTGDNTLRTLRTGLTSATSALTSPSSPLGRLAKGVQSLGSNLDRKLRNERSSEMEENEKIKEKWATSGCRSKLIPL